MIKQIVSLSFLLVSSLLIADTLTAPLIEKSGIKQQEDTSANEVMDIKKIESVAKNNPYLNDINYLIGVYYMAGDVAKNIRPDFRKAMEYLLRDKDNVAMANYKIAELYYYGYGVKQNYKKAIEYFERSINEKFNDYRAVAPISLLAISEIYIKQLKEYKNALPYVLDAAQKFNKVDAQMTLAFMYIDGKGVKVDADEANFWINQAYFNKEATGEHKAYMSNFIESAKDFDLDADVENYCGVIQ